jgi:hypothetical protein
MAGSQSLEKARMAVRLFPITANFLAMRRDEGQMIVMVMFIL